MELFAIECPKCKRKVYIDKLSDKVFCMSCRIEVQVQQPSTDDASISRDFAVKMSIAERFEELYFIGGKSFDQVMGAYDDAEGIGAQHVEYWVARTRFYARGMLNEISKGEVDSSKQKAIVDQYTVLMKIVLRFAIANKPTIEKEKDDTIATIKRAFVLEEKRREDEEKRHRKRSRVRSGLLAIPLLILLVVFSLNDQLDDQDNYDDQAEENGSLVGDEDRDWPQIAAESREWPSEDVRRWAGYLAEVSVDNWTFERTQYNNFLEMEYLVELMTVRPTRDGIENMEMELSGSPDSLYTELRIGEHSLQFLFHDNQHPETVSTIAMHYVRYFDGLALYELAEYDINDIAGVFIVNYEVPVLVWEEGIILFAYQGLEFELHSFGNFGATVIVRPID